jgi:hypothetical protein
LGPKLAFELEQRLKTKKPEGKIHFGLEMCAQGEA